MPTPRGEGEGEEATPQQAEPEFPHVEQPPPYGIARYGHLGPQPLPLTPNPYPYPYPCP